MENSLISIIIPAYNAFKYIEATTNSWLNQTYPNFEIIIQDDRSTDGTWELISDLYASHPKVKLFRNERNLGIGGNWNAAYQKANGELLVIFNADDLVIPSILDEFLGLLNADKSIDIVTGKFEILDTKTGTTILYPDHINMESGIIDNKTLFKQLYFKLGFHWNFTLIKRSLLEKVVLPNGELFINTQVCDYELWFRCFLAGAKVYFNGTKIWGQYRKHETNNSSKPNAELRSFLKDFLQRHYISFKKFGADSYTSELIRRTFTFCNSKKFEIDILYLYIKRIVQSLI